MLLGNTWQYYSIISHPTYSSDLLQATAWSPPEKYKPSKKKNKKKTEEAGNKFRSALLSSACSLLLPVSCLAYSSTPKTEEIHSSKIWDSLSSLHVSFVIFYSIILLLFYSTHKTCCWYFYYLKPETILITINYTCARAHNGHCFMWMIFNNRQCVKLYKLYKGLPLILTNKN
jgi:hypothetical protein